MNKHCGNCHLFYESIGICVLEGTGLCAKDGHATTADTNGCDDWIEDTLPCFCAVGSIEKKEKKG
jgi:hypothetical protein